MALDTNVQRRMVATKTYNPVFCGQGVNVTTSEWMWNLQIFLAFRSVWSNIKTNWSTRWKQAYLYFYAEICSSERSLDSASYHYAYILRSPWILESFRCNVFYPKVQLLYKLGRCRTSLEVWRCTYLFCKSTGLALYTTVCGYTVVNVLRTYFTGTVKSVCKWKNYLDIVLEVASIEFVPSFRSILQALAVSQTFFLHYLLMDT